MTITAVIPTLNAANTLSNTLQCLKGMPLLISDGGSRDGTVALAESLGATVIHSPSGRGRQLHEGALAAKGDWLLFLHGDTVLEEGWEDEARAFMVESVRHARARHGHPRVLHGAEKAVDGRDKPGHDEGGGNKAAYFRFALDDPSAKARRVERLVAWRCQVFGLPYGDQGLLISRRFYDTLGGYDPSLPLMEDVDLARRIGRARLVGLQSRAVTSAERYRRDGYWLRPLRNILCLGLFLGGLPVSMVRRLYG